jgi:hypothetical protein
MKERKSQPFLVFAILILLALACSLPGSTSPTEEPVIPTNTPGSEPASQPEPPPAEEEAVGHNHVIFPASAPASKVFYDAESSGTAPEKRAPYGDSYDISRLERPFLQDMTYIPDLDVHTFSISQDDEFYYVSIRLIGDNPNNEIGINYAVEMDVNRDGFGDFIVVAEPPYSGEWSAKNVKVYEDTNKDTGGRSAVKSDAPFEGDGYDKLIYDGAGGVGEDPDLAWVRMDAGANATIQFAFKKSLPGNIFMFGVMADAWLKDVSKMDYVDRFTEAQAGSPVRRSAHYPLKEIHSVDNTCWEAVGFKSTGYEPKICPVDQPPTPAPGVVGCVNPSQYGDQASCQAAGCIWTINPAVLTLVAYHCVSP